jgi:chromosome segregation ATPase
MDMEEKVKINTEDIKYLKSRCSKYDIDYALMCKDISEIKESITEIKQNQEKYMASMAQFMEKLDGRFAGKWVEKIMWGGGAVIGTAILVAIFEVIFRG